MALLYMDSFDHYVTADLLEKWTTASAGASSTGTIAAVGRRGSGAFRWTTGGLQNGSAALLRTLAPGSPAGRCGFAVAVAAGTVDSAGIALASFRDGATAQVALRLNADGTLSVCRGTQGGTVLGTSTATLPAGTYAYVEWAVLIDPSAGTTEVRVNGASILSLTGQNTRATANTQWTAFALGSAEGVAFGLTATVGKTIDFDDLYVLDGTGSAPTNALLGDCRVDARRPTAAGATAAWTPSAGANYETVDDTTPDDDTTHNTTATVSAIDTFVTEDAPVPGAIIYGIQHCLNARKLDAGDCTLAAVVRHSGTDYAAADHAPGTAYSYLLTVQELNPGTAAAWTESDFNAAEFGYQRTG